MSLSVMASQEEWSLPRPYELISKSFGKGGETEPGLQIYNKSPRLQMDGKFICKGG